MLTLVALLFFPVILALSIYRLVQLPRDILARKKWFNPEHWWIAMLSAGAAYVALGLYTVTVLAGWVVLLIRAPMTIRELFAAASVLVGYPVVYLVFEWVYHYALNPRPTRY